jgi:hypothetical protein
MTKTSSRTALQLQLPANLKRNSAKGRLPGPPHTLDWLLLRLRTVRRISVIRHCLDYRVVGAQAKFIVQCSEL